MSDEVYGDPPSPEAIAALVAVLGLAIDRYVKNRARRTIVENAKADPAKPKCRWVVEPDACDRCKARGSFWVDPGEIPTESHSGCKCHLAVLFNKAYEFISGMVDRIEARKLDKILSNERFFGHHKTPVGKVSIDSEQFGHKSGQHMVDYGLNPSNASDRLVFRRLIYDMLSDPDSVRLGWWHGAREYPAYFFVRAEDAIIVNKETKEYVSILQGALDVNDRPNKRVQSARIVYERS